MHIIIICQSYLNKDGKIKGKKSICMVNWFSINVPGEQNWKRIVFSTNHVGAVGKEKEL